MEKVYDFCIMLVVAAIAALLYRRFNFMQVFATTFCPSWGFNIPPKLGYLIMTVFSQTGDNDAGLGDWMVEILIWHAVIFALVFCGTSTGSLLLLLSRAVFNYDLGCFRLIWHLYHHEYGSCKPVHRSWHRIQGDNWIFKVVTSWYWFRWFLELKDLMEPGENLSAWGRVMCPRLIFKTM